MRAYIVAKNGKLYYTYSKDKAIKLNAKIVCEVWGLNLRIFGIENLQ